MNPEEIAKRMAETIIKIGIERPQPKPESKRNSAYYEESHRLYQAQMLKR